MRLYFVPPPEGEPLAAGELYADNGEKIEGVMVVSAWTDDRDVASVQFTLLVERVPELDRRTLGRTLDGLLAMEEALAEP